MIFCGRLDCRLIQDKLLEMFYKSFVSMPSFDLGFAPTPHLSARPGYDGTSLQAFFADFPDDDTCLEYVFRQRFGPNPRCPRCGRTGLWRRHHFQKHYFHGCGGILSPMAGVVFSRSRIPLQLWFYAMLHYANSAESVVSPFLARQLGVSEPTAFRLGERIRWHMAAIDDKTRLGTGGKPVVVRFFKIRRIINPHTNTQNSAMVMVMCDGKSVNSTLVFRPRVKELRPIIRLKINPFSKIITDDYLTFRVLSNYNSGVPVAEFSPDYYHSKPGYENLNHGFMQYFNLSFSNQFRGVNLENAWLYLKEYEFRYNRRNRSAGTFADLVSCFPSFDEDNLALIKARHSILVPRR